MAKKQAYIITPEEIRESDNTLFEEVSIRHTLKAAKKLQQELIKEDGILATDDCPPTNYRIYRLELVE